MLHKCCKKKKNLELQPSEKVELKIKKCKICGRRHFTLMAEPGFLGLTMKQKD